MKPRGSSRMDGFFRLESKERFAILKERISHSTPEEWIGVGVSKDLVNQMVENAVGVMEIPLGVAANFTVNKLDVWVPMAIEEPSVIAAASNAAKMVRAGGGFLAHTASHLTVAQVEILNPGPGAAGRLAEAEQEILEIGNQSQSELVGIGGGARSVEVRESVGSGNRLVVHLAVDCVDAMGANSVNTMAEAVAPRIQEISQGEVGLRIVTNLADQRLVEISCEVPLEALARRGFAGKDVATGIVSASRFAAGDPYRAATHNKGIFNGIDAVLVATGNDWRAVEAGGHAFAASSGAYGPLSTWRMHGDSLLGSLKMPMAVGIVGGASNIHPTADFALELLGIESAAELAWVVGSAGLACNLAALAALSSEGIQHGHMRLHRRKQ